MHSHVYVWMYDCHQVRLNEGHGLCQATLDEIANTYICRACSSRVARLDGSGFNSFLVTFDQQKDHAVVFRAAQRCEVVGVHPTCGWACAMGVREGCAPVAAATVEVGRGELVAGAQDMYLRSN